MRNRNPVDDQDHRQHVAPEFRSARSAPSVSSAQHRGQHDHDLQSRRGEARRRMPAAHSALEQTPDQQQAPATGGTTRSARMPALVATRPITMSAKTTRDRESGADAVARAARSRFRRSASVAESRDGEWRQADEDQKQERDKADLGQPIRAAARCARTAKRRAALSFAMDHRIFVVVAAEHRGSLAGRATELCTARYARRAGMGSDGGQQQRRTAANTPAIFASSRASARHARDDVSAARACRNCRCDRRAAAPSPDVAREAGTWA